MLLQFTSAVEEQQFTPVISMMSVLLVIVVDLLLLVFFIHHIASGIQADNIIAQVYDDLYRQLDAMFPDKLEDSAHLPAMDDADDELAAEFDRRGWPVAADRAGYLQAVDADGLYALALDKDIAIQVNYRPGHFVMQDISLAVCLSQGDEPDEDIRSAINRHFIIGSLRTPEQDAEYALRQLVEVALRALSPGINDSFTAITCIHWLGNALALSLDRHFPTNRHFDEEGRLRLQLRPFSFEGMLAAAFNQIRQNAGFHVAVIIALLETLQALAEQAQTREQVRAIRKQVEATYYVAGDEVKAQRDRDAIDVCYQEACAVLDTFDSVNQ